jgi:hypothetical protein
MGVSSFELDGDDADADEVDNAVAVPRYPGPLTEKLSFIPLFDAKVVISSMSAIVSLLGGVADNDIIIVDDGGIDDRGGIINAATEPVSDAANKRQFKK